MLEDIRTLGVPDKYIKLINMTLDRSKATIRVDGELSSTFEINLEVRQGDAFSSMKFNLVLEAVMKNINYRGHIEIKSSQICTYVDDVAVISRNKTILEETFTQIDRESQKRGLIINENKTKYMEVRRTPTNNNNWPKHCDCKASNQRKKTIITTSKSKVITLNT